MIRLSLALAVLPKDAFHNDSHLGAGGFANRPKMWQHAREGTNDPRLLARRILNPSLPMLSATPGIARLTPCLLN